MQKHYLYPSRTLHCGRTDQGVLRVEKDLDMKLLNTMYYTDRKDVLHWIRNEMNSFTHYVSTRRDCIVFRLSIKIYILVIIKKILRVVSSAYLVRHCISAELLLPLVLGLQHLLEPAWSFSSSLHVPVPFKKQHLVLVTVWSPYYSCYKFLLYIRNETTKFFIFCYFMQFFVR